MYFAATAKHISPSATFPLPAQSSSAYFGLLVLSSFLDVFSDLSGLFFYNCRISVQNVTKNSVQCPLSILYSEKSTSFFQLHSQQKSNLKTSHALSENTGYIFSFRNAIYSAQLHRKRFLPSPSNGLYTLSTFFLLCTDLATHSVTAFGLYWIPTALEQLCLHRTTYIFSVQRVFVIHSMPHSNNCRNSTTSHVCVLRFPH